MCCADEDFLFYLDSSGKVTTVGENGSCLKKETEMPSSEAKKDRDKPKIALVLSGGGARGAYQAGYLKGLSEILDDDFPFPVITGVSAGAINAMALASHRGTFKEATDDLIKAWQYLKIEEVFQTSFGSLSWSFFRWLWMLGTGGLDLGVRGVFNTKPLFRYLTTHLHPEGIRVNIASGRLSALALSTTSYATGQTVTFIQGEEGIRGWKRSRRLATLSELGIEHVMASAALPILFPAIRVENCFYGDGSIRQASPLAPAVHLGADRILAISLRYTPPEQKALALTTSPMYPPPARILGLMMHGVFLDALENDAERLLRINRTLSMVPGGMLPDRMRRIELFTSHPSENLGKMAHELMDHLPRTLRVLLGGLGASKTKGNDFVSYILFERPYIDQLIELGRQDALDNRESLLELFSYKGKTEVED